MKSIFCLWVIFLSSIVFAQTPAPQASPAAKDVTQEAPLKFDKKKKLQIKKSSKSSAKAVTKPAKEKPEPPSKSTEQLIEESDRSDLDQE